MRDLQFMRTALFGSALVLEMAVLTLGGFFTGAWLDTKLGTSPLFLAALTLLGFVGGLIRLIRVLGRLAEHDDGPPEDPG